MSDVPSASASDSTGSRRSLAAGLLLGAVGATVVLLASGQVWAEGRAARPTIARAAGAPVTSWPSAVSGAGRRVVAALLALSGLGAALSAWAGASDS
ncbi:TIGR02234 family membrane protein, partial [Streptomyces sp. MBT57]|nr:TIGR02234 family membrane protein [Streptomyces sp. MBT57]